MTFRSLWQAWNEFWFKPGSPLPIALYRIMFGCIILVHLALLIPDLSIWYGPNGIVSAETVRQWPFDVLIDPLMLMPPTEEALKIFTTIFALSACALTLGLFTRLSAILVFLGLVSFHHRDWATINSGDIFMRLAALYIACSNAGKVISLDRIIEVWVSKKVPSSAPPVVSMWAHRLLQLQLCILYCQAFWSKVDGKMWISGNALYYVARLEDLRRFAMPDFIANNLLLLRLMTWFTLLTEFALWTLIWIKECRYWVLFAGLCLHLGIDIFMNLPLFEYLMVTVYVLWIDPEDLSKTMNVVRRMARKLAPKPKQITFDPSKMKDCRIAETIRRLDVLHLYELTQKVSTAKFD